MKHSIERLTPEIIEACMDRESVVFDRPDEVIVSSDRAEMQVFNACVMSSKKLRRELFGIAHALYKNETLSSDTPIDVAEKVKNLFAAGVVTSPQLQLIEQACREFFFLGWHARGAIEEAEQLRRMAE